MMRLLVCVLFSVAWLEGQQGSRDLEFELWRLAMTNVSGREDQQAAERRGLVYEKRQFEERFNELVRLLALFAETYNRSQGNVVPADKLKEIKKAWEKLERTSTFALGGSGGNKR